MSRKALSRAQANIIITFHNMEIEKHEEKQPPLYNKTQKYKECKKYSGNFAYFMEIV